MLALSFGFASRSAYPALHWLQSWPDEHFRDPTSRIPRRPCPPWPSWPGCRRSPSAGWCGCRTWWRRRPGPGSKRRCGSLVMCRTSWPARWPAAPHPFGRRAGADDRQFDLRRYRAGPVRRTGAARLCGDPGAVALRRRARGSHAGGAAVAAARSDHHGGLARDRRRRAAVAPRRHSDRRDLGDSGRADRRGRGIQQLRGRLRGGAASGRRKAGKTSPSSAATIRARRGAGTDFNDTALQRRR